MNSFVSLLWLYLVIFFRFPLSIITYGLSFLSMTSSPSAEAANIPADALDKVPNNSPSNGLSMALASQQLTDVYFPLLFL
jgi:hypothetical protein